MDPEALPAGYHMPLQALALIRPQACGCETSNAGVAPYPSNFR